MVNYCCVYGCGRNSRLNRHLIFYSIPKEKNRQVLWLKAAGREDLLKKDEKAIGRRRFCSRHFNASCIKKRNLSADAVPTLHIPGSEGEETDWGAECLRHEGIVCNNCQDTVSGFRYKCVTCTDYDLCQKCEGLEVHPDHFMLRIPKPMKLVVAENLTKQLHTLIKAEHLTPEDPSSHDDRDEGTVDIDSESSDDEPITKYASNYDSGVDLSEDVKERIRKEVSRVLKLKPKKSKATPKTSADKKRTSDESPRPTKKPKLEETCNYNSNTLIESMDEVEIAPEVAFADVNAVKDNQTSEMKAEIAESVNINETVPVMHLKLSDDLSELMIEVTSNNSKTVYKYGDNRWNRGNLGSS